MLMADAFAITLVIIGFLLAFQALWLTARGFWPGMVERSKVRAATQPWRCAFVGGLVAVGGVTLGLIIAQAGAPGAILGTTLICLTLCWCHVGVAGLVTHLGERLPSKVDRDSPWRATMRGGAALEFTYLLPILGWLGIMPLTWIIGAGAATLAWRDGRRQRREAALPTLDASPQQVEQARPTTPPLGAPAPAPVAAPAPAPVAAPAPAPAPVAHAAPMAPMAPSNGLHSVALPSPAEQLEAQLAQADARALSAALTPPIAAPVGVSDAVSAGRPTE